MKSKMGERGFTLIELVVGLSIAAFVVSAASMTTVTMMRLTPQNNDWAVALRQVQNAGHWISHDIQTAQGDITVGTGNPTFLTLTVPEWETDEVVNKTVVYEFEDMPDGLKRLMRNNQTDVEETVIAENISNAVADFTVASGMLTFTITATSGTATVARDYEAMQRVPPAPEP
ncbi:MAG: type II secretion system GspH family protein [Dehalococcoidia bacterium]|nr:type II secretion system GspH family protein [Dehalococcoidia bacterium]